MMLPTVDFDWSGEDEVVLREQPATAVYLSAAEEIVIRQQQSWDEDTDTLVRIQPRNARLIVNAILEITAFLDGENTADRRPPHPNEPPTSPQYRLERTDDTNVGDELSLFQTTDENK